jgi:molecular chaperone HtpG
MPEDQKYIYFITGESLDKVMNSPFLEKVAAKGYEVVYMVDPLDEYVVGSVTEYEGVELQSVTKEGMKLGDEERKSLKKLKEEYKPLTEWMKTALGDRVEKVPPTSCLWPLASRISPRLTLPLASRL